MRVEIIDSTTPMLLAISLVSRDVAFEQMSKIGNAIRKNTGNRMRSPRNRHHWLQVRTKNGKRRPLYDPNKTKELGFRTKLDGSVASPDSMSNMISSNLMEESGVLVVGGRNARKRVNIRRDGKVVGSQTLPAITKHTQSIINKLDMGERNRYHGWGSGGNLKESMPNFRNASYRAAHFMAKGFAESLPYMKQELTSGYEKTVGRAVNRVQVRIKPEVRTVL